MLRCSSRFLTIGRISELMPADWWPESIHLMALSWSNGISAGRKKMLNVRNLLTIEKWIRLKLVGTDWNASKFEGNRLNLVPIGRQMSESRVAVKLHDSKLKLRNQKFKNFTKMFSTSKRVERLLIQKLSWVPLDLSMAFSWRKPDT